MTFSIVGRSFDGSALGVAVASRFLAIGSYVPAASAVLGALATQADVNLALKPRGMQLLADGLNAEEMLAAFFADDPGRANRQAGAIDINGVAATFTGDACTPWAGGSAATGPYGAYAAQGNSLTGPDVVEAMVEHWKSSAAEESLGRRLLGALKAGDAKGGDKRGRQSAAIFVVAVGAGYGGTSDVLMDLRCDDSPKPVAELERLVGLHDLYFGKPREDQLLPLDEKLSAELAALLKTKGFSGGDVHRDLEAWMRRENFEERWRDGKIDPVVLNQLRA